MKKTFLISLLGVLISPLFSQDLNHVIMDTSINEEILFGYCDRDAFENELFNTWFTEEHESYKLDEKTLTEIDFKNNSQPEITIVMGTWCSDSRREVPRFYKIMEKLEYDFDNLTLITVNRQKKAGDIEIDNLNVELVPTLIFYENGVEKGRIIESPVKSLEKDIVEILSE